MTSSFQHSGSCSLLVWRNIIQGKRVRPIGDEVLRQGSGAETYSMGHGVFLISEDSQVHQVSSSIRLIPGKVRNGCIADQQLTDTDMEPIPSTRQSW